ncbi:Coproporphyrinogen III oxidase, aerobic [Enhygromyxa salina]|uniref:coproporphyrinogen oxidase n=1 Tax=Enhygromyxa salina TaxID=215803 RepID=A0A0C2CTB6_9BACT|nr:coproporphyrinogen III oxidase [Enhygromyxa salina]KIG14411.1 Coproporphyrinogen III oxidase, aerobic [Enhygromyxa salina]
MARIRSRSQSAGSALDLVEALQRRFKLGLEQLCVQLGAAPSFETLEWLRDDGRHGGGHRYVAGQTQVFNRAAINVSQVHYDDDPSRKLGSASALSTIIHPQDPRAPSVHIHISWTERKPRLPPPKPGPQPDTDQLGYWRLMADLNPAIPHPAATASFAAALREVAPELYAQASAEGDRYFFIPALGRCRGATHYYLEGHASGDLDADLRLAQRFGEAAIDRYLALLGEAIEPSQPPSEEQRAQQLAYHSLYLFQVLTLDRGTTSGLLVHDQNDVGIMGSLPSFVDRELLASWLPRLPDVQKPLLRGILDALPQRSPSLVSDETRAALAKRLRAHYRAHPEALALQASGSIVTNEIHRA